MTNQFISAFPDIRNENLAAFTNTKAALIHSIPDLKKFLDTKYSWIKGIHYLQQIHSISSIEVHDQGKGMTCYPDQDALFTMDPNQGLVIQTADCLPIFLYHPSSSLIGLVHAGWRGVYAGILSEILTTIKNKYQPDLSSMKVSIGPSIRKCCFEVGNDVKDLFQSRYENITGLIDNSHIDLQSVIQFQCRQFHIPDSNMFTSSECTMCHGEKYHSFRRNGKKSGRLYSVIARQKY